MEYYQPDKLTGIYEIKNILNNHRYIGSSINLRKRFYEHLSLLKKSKHSNSYLQNAWNKYGKKHFVFNVLETCEPIKDTLLAIEQKYLDLDPEYNICKIAGNTMGRKLSKGGRKKIGLANKTRKIKDSTRVKHSNNSKNSEWNKKQRKPVFMVDVDTLKVVKEFKSVMDAAKYLGHIDHRVNIKQCYQGKQKTAYGYKWILKIK